MKYLTFATNANARSRSGAVATALGCGQKAEDVTRFWFAVVDHPTNIPQAALVIPDGEEGRLTAAEQLQLKDRAFMVTQGWFSA